VRTSSNLLKVERLQKILNIVTSKQRVSLLGLEKSLDVSRITIQRDLVELEKHKQLRRFHGGAMSLDYSNRFSDHHMRKTVNIETKKKIACKALDLIKPGDYIGLDSSTTVYYLSEQMLPPNVFVLSCGIDAFNNLSLNNNLTIMLSGGRLKKETNTLVGREAVETIRKIHFNLVFISVEVYVPGKGFFNPYEDEVSMKKALIESSSKTAMLMDASKIGNAGGIKVCDGKDIDYFVTDDPADKIVRKFLKDKAI